MGLQYWTAKLTDGSETRGTLLKTILTAAHSFKGDQTYGWVADLLDNELALSYRYAIVEGISLNLPADAYANGAKISAAITPTNVDLAHQMIDELIGAPRDFFVTVDKAFSNEQSLYNLFDPSLANLGGGPVPIGAFELDNDGKAELLFPMQKAIISNAGEVSTTPCKSRLVIYSLDKSEHFVDVTANFIDGSFDLGGCARKVKAIDINGDGKIDFFCAINQEEGRTADAPSVMTAQLAGLISQPDGRYKIQKFGPSNWYHNVGVARSIDGASFVTDAGFTFGTNSNFVYQTSGKSELHETLPWMSANAFQFISINTSQGDDFLVMTGTYPALFSVEAYQIQADGKWSLVSTNPAPYTILGREKFKHQIQDSTASDIIVGRTNDQILIDGGTGYALTESCSIRINPSAKPSVLMKMEMLISRGFKVSSKVWEVHMTGSMVFSKGVKTIR